MDANLWSNDTPVPYILENVNYGMLRSIVYFHLVVSVDVNLWNNDTPVAEILDIVNSRILRSTT